ncbi:MAG: LysR family transcriptional regulator [Opitutales bacterium]
MKRIRPFDTRQLEAFDMLCRTGSFTKTAKHLFLTQSAVSHSMKNLEEEAGCRLFRRQGKRVTLTEAGDHLLSFVRPFLFEMENVRDELDGFEKFGTGRIRLGASTQACRFFLPPILKEFKETQPLCRFEVKCEDTPGCFDLLSEGKIDLAITLSPINITEIEFVPCFNDELRVVVPPSHDWVKNKKNDWDDAGSENFILYNRGSYTFRILTDYFDKLGVRLSSFMEISSPEASKELIKVGMGVGILADWAVEDDVQRGELVSLPLGPKKLSRTWGISVRKGRKLNKAERMFIKIAEESGCHWMVNRKL